jgi:hypothetical protein
MVIRRRGLKPGKPGLAKKSILPLNLSKTVAKKWAEEDKAFWTKKNILTTPKFFIRQCREKNMTEENIRAALREANLPKKKIDEFIVQK